MTAATSLPFHIVVIGAGPAGLAAGAQAARRGVSHVVLERNALAHTIVRYQKGKHVMAEPPALPLRAEITLPFRAGSREEVLDAWTEGTRKAGTNLRIGPENEVVQISGRKGGFTLKLRGGEVRGEHIVVAIGVQGNLRKFDVPGSGLPHVAYQLDDPGEHVEQRIVVVGVGDAGIENALALAADNEVSIINRSAEIDRAKPANKHQLEAAIQSGQIAYYPNSKVNRFEERCVVLDTDEGQIRLEADLVIGRLGAIPPRQFLESIGIVLPSPDREAVPQVSATYESNVPGIHLVGAVAGYPLIKNGLNQGCEVIEHILGNPVEPADEPLLREKFAPLGGTVNEVLERIRTTIPIFGEKGLTTIQLREFLADSTVHVRQAGDVIFERNAFEDGFYSILDGSVEIIAPRSDADTDTVYGGAAKARERRLAIGPGGFFGEIGLLSGRRRSATVVAKTDCILIEAPRASMSRLTKSVPGVRRVLDGAFTVRKLRDFLSDDIPMDTVAALAEQAVVESFEQNQMLFEQGAPSDGLHVIRRGSVTVSHRNGDREVVLAYVPAGNVVGEMALFSPENRRTASVRANVRTETIRVPSEAIRAFVERYPAVREQLEQLSSERLVENVARSADTSGGDVVTFLMGTGAGEATDMLLIDESICVRCDNCEKACAATHGGISRLDREAGPTFATVHVPTSCRHCENPKCMTDCPPDALRRHSNGEVFIMDNCIGCGNCAANCPYDVIQMAAVEPPRRPNLLLRLLFGLGETAARPDPSAAKLAVKCDLCRELPSVQRGGPTACVASCPTGAILRVNPQSFVEQLLPTSR